MRRLLLFAPTLLVGFTYGQAVVESGNPVRSQAAFRQLWDDTRKLQVSLLLDRKEYFPGEEATLTVTIADTGPRPVEIFEPLNIRTGLVELYQQKAGSNKADAGAWRRVYLTEGIELGRDTPSTWLHPGGPVETKYVTSDPNHSTVLNAQRGRTSSICARCAIPEEEGSYRFRYEYGPEPTVDFTVVWPTLEQWTQVRLGKDAQFTDRSSNRVYTHIPRLVRFAILGYQNNHIVVVAVNPKTGAPPDRDRNGKFTGLVSRSFSPYRRIAVNASPITALQAVADAAENITLTYSDQTGRSFILKLNANRDLIR